MLTESSEGAKSMTSSGSKRDWSSSTPAKMSSCDSSGSIGEHGASRETKLESEKMQVEWPNSWISLEDDTSEQPRNLSMEE